MKDLDQSASSQSPLDKVHQLAIYVHSSPRRRDEFETVRAVKNPETSKGLLPLKDVKTRWNSKEAAISRVIRLRKTIVAFTTRAGSKCPRFTKQDFDALEIIQPTLKVFLHLTLVHSEVGANAHRILPDLVYAIDKLQELHSHPSVSSSRRQSSDAAVKKLRKYLSRFIKNKWVCAAMALDPTVRQIGLEKLLTEEYKADAHFKDTIRFIKGSVSDCQSMTEDPADEGEDEVRVTRKPDRPNRFASDQYQTGHQEAIDFDVKDPWSCYTAKAARYATFAGEPVLAYWKRMAEYKEMLPLAMVARDVLGLASSSASVERLFSHAGHVLGKKRGSLSARLLAKQTMLRMWEMQGLLEVGAL
ncbi:hypothetical protein QFC22_001640 [Naganishia vaughanmartiniae]|uniref:Uncharacterized protein n=2 Tax=Naganishia vaughanmartiniae TaxID=1424756 RepID=A0ACC2XL47_9TREE|nr:hypothetical protein QFC22_004937 [Naganishia vaughanmartiniae]KAJ9123437.1 hypothetical protein QFC22_001640 [Naganishia vaughanmartiniae]